MKILHVTATHLKPVGGVPVVLKNLVNEQNKIENFESEVISLVAPVDEMNSKYFKYVKLKDFERFLNDYYPDFVILHSFYYMEYCKVVNILVRKKIKYFIEPHGSFGHAAMKKSKIKKIIANNTIFLKQIKKAYGFIFLNDVEKKDSIYRTKNDIVIPNGIDSSNINKNILEKDLINFYFIGRYHIPSKGLDVLFDALDILEKDCFKINFNMWGSGSDIQYIKERASKYNHINVKINDSIYDDEKNKVLEQYGIMLLTSRYEGFPMTILEAWKYGNPCVVTPGTNVADEIADNDLGWKVELNALSISNGIRKAYDSYSKKRIKYIKKCKNYVCKNYSWDLIAKKSFEELNKK